MAGEQGSRSSMEDESITLTLRLEHRPGDDCSFVALLRRLVAGPLPAPQFVTLAAIFDGHGGDETSRWLGDNLPRILQRHGSQLLSNVSRGLRTAFGAAEAQLQRELRAPVSGATALCALVVDDMLHVANVGDSRAVLVERCLEGAPTCRPLSRDHKPNEAAEAARLEALDADVIDGYLCDGFGFPQLGVSRAFGDYYLKQGSPGPPRGALTEAPEVTSLSLRELMSPAATTVAGVGSDLQQPQPPPAGGSVSTASAPDGAAAGSKGSGGEGGGGASLHATPTVLVLACDGLWDVLSNDDVAALVSEKLRAGDAPPQVAQQLVQTALAKGSTDNVSATVLLLTRSAAWCN